MDKKISRLLLFILSLSLSGNVLAEDLNPPDFAGGNQTGVIFWEFNEDNDKPARFKYYPRSRDESEGNRFGFRYYEDSWQWQEGGYLAMDGGEESLVMPLPVGDGANLRGYMQVVWDGTLEDPPLSIAPEIWLDYDAEFLNDEELILEPVKNIEKGNQRWYTTFEWTFEDWPELGRATHCHLLWNLDTDYKFRLDEVIVDLVIFDGDEPPEGPGRVGIKLLGAKDRATSASAQDKDKPITLDTDPHLAGLWKLDDTSGKTAIDSSKNNRKGTLNGGLSFDKNSTEGRTGKALKFDGGDEYIQIEKYKGVTSTKPRTVAAWIKTENDNGEIMSWGADDFGKMFTFRFIRGRLGITPNGGYYYMNEPVDDDQWHHVAVVVKEAELPNLHDDVVLYKDGIIAEVHDIGLLDLWPVDTGSDLDVTIGRGFEGLIDDVRIYDRVLSDEEVMALFKLQSNRPLPKSKK